MKKGYLLILFFFMLTFSYGQDKEEITSQDTSFTKTKEIKGFDIYPNPVSDGFFRIKTLNNAERTIDIYDVLGKLVFFKTTKKNLIDVSTLKSGIYIIKVYELGNSATRKLIIK